MAAQKFYDEIYIKPKNLRNSIHEIAEFLFDDPHQIRQLL